MKELSDKTERHSVYVKLPVYVGQFMRHVCRAAKDGSISLPDGTEFSACFNSYLTENTDMKAREKRRIGGRERDRLSYSQAAFELSLMKNRPRETYRMKVPLRREHHNLFGFFIPGKVWRSSGEVTTNEYYELSLHGGRAFRAMCANLFWSSLRRYIVGQEHEAIRLGKIFNRSLTIERFMEFHGVSTEHHDTVVRTYQRKYSDIYTNIS